MGIIYRAFNVITHKSYIGQTIQPLHIRKQQHYVAAKKDNNPFHRALKKYKATDWEWTILENIDNECELNQRESFYIKEIKSHIKENGYNCTYGEERDSRRTIFQHSNKEEIVKKISMSCKGSNHYLNKMTQEERERWLDINRRGENHFTSKMTKEEFDTWSKEKKQIARPQYTGGNRTEAQKANDMRLSIEKRGKKDTEEERVLKSEGWAKSKYRGEVHHYYGKHQEQPKKRKTIVIIFPDGKELVVIGIDNFCKKYNLQRSNITNVLKGIEKSTKGFKARVYNENEDISVPKWDGKTIITKYVREVKGRDLKEPVIFILPSGEEIFCSNILSFTKEYNLHNSSIWRLYRGEIKQHKGIEVRHPSKEIGIHLKED